MLGNTKGYEMLGHTLRTDVATRILLAVLLALSATGSVIAADAPQTPTSIAAELGVAREVSKASVSQGIRHCIGDQLKIVLHERLQLSAESIGDSTDGLVERAELTGVYSVLESGQIVVPILGSIDAEGRLTAEIARALEGAFKQAFGREARASILLEEREPIYIAVKHSPAATIKYTPGMTILHAIALAGSSQDARGDAYVRMERLRERERQQKANARLVTLLARLAVLTHETGGDEAQYRHKLTVLVGTTKASPAIEEEGRRRKVTLDSNKLGVHSAVAAVAVAKREKANLDAKLAVLDDSIRERGNRRDTVNSLRDRGTANNFLSSQVKNELSDARERRQDVLNEIAGVDLKLTRAEDDLQKLHADMKADRQQLMSAIEDEIMEQEATLAGSQNLIEDLDVAVYASDRENKARAFEIIRRARNGSRRFAAEEMTELRPGDLVRTLEVAPVASEAKISARISPADQITNSIDAHLGTEVPAAAPKPR